MISVGPDKSDASSAAAASCCSCQERRPAMMTLVSRAVGGIFLLPTLADLSKHTSNGRFRERWSLLGRNSDPQRALLDEPDLTRQRLDLYSSFLDGDPQRHPGQEPRLVTHRL